MMATTHALVGFAIAVLVAPDAAPAVLAAGFAGGAFPDLDLYAGHRKTLHFPVYYALLALPLGLLAAFAPGTWTLAAAVFVVAAAVHSAMDAFGGGLELRPWEGTSDRAVYDHFNGRWLPPKRWVRYDGAPEDLGLAAVAAVPPILAVSGGLELLAFGALAVSAVYVLVRKPMVAVAEWLVARTPPTVLDYVPERFVQDL
ncbi:metal-dependent hydrolase [Salarchaeum japonicum]|nr:metal-dependent hydrolase [Salarchaeum japonicum]